MCHEWRRAIEQRCIIEHQAVFRSDKCWQHGEVGSENVNWGYRMTNWQLLIQTEGRMVGQLPQS